MTRDESHNSCLTYRLQCCLETTKDYNGGLLVREPNPLPEGGLEGEEEEESHHKAEESHSLGQGKAQDGVGEQLLLQAGVPK